MNFKQDFPIFHHRPDLIYFDNGATSQKPKCVIDAIQNFYEQNNSNIHRGPNFLSEEATVLYENARKTVADFVCAKKASEIIFTRNATESINLVARTFGETLKHGDTIVLSKLEHHANIVPWLQLKERKGIKLRYFDVTDDGFIKFDPDLIDETVKLASVSGMSNVTGAITDLSPIIKRAHEVGAKVLIDAAQLAVHQPIDVKKMGADFLVFTGHKVYGPTGIGVLYGKEDLLNKMPPFLGGGDMIDDVRLDRFTPAQLPNKFEAGTPNIAGAVGLKAAIDYINQIGFPVIRKTENGLTEYLISKLSELPFIKIIGPADNKNRGSIVSFIMDGVHSHDIAEGLSKQNICIRAGHHCAQPYMDLLGIPGTARISLVFYNTIEEIDKCCKVLREIYNYFY